MRNVKVVNSLCAGSVSARKHVRLMAGMKFSCLPQQIVNSIIMKRKFDKKISHILVMVAFYIMGSIPIVAQNPKQPEPAPSNPYPQGLPSPVKPVPPPGLKTDTMSIPRPVKPQLVDTVRIHRDVIPPSDTASSPVPKRKK
jgi:hypothetical protein